MPTQDGRYSAKLLIGIDKRSHIDFQNVKVIPNVFDTEEEAANASRIAGRLWVEDRS